MTQAFNKMHFESKSFKKLHLFPMVTITPDLAKDLLTLNTDNRPLKNNVLQKYTFDMKEGRWQFTGDIIQISKTGKLLNGQHRLWAIINSGKSQQFHVQAGLEESSFENMDVGKNRTAADALAVKGWDNYTTLSGLLRIVMQYKRDKIKQVTLGSSSVKQISIHEITEFAETQNKQLLKECATAASTFFKRFRVLSSSSYGAFLYIFSLKSREDAFEFFDMVTTGDNISSESRSSIFLLRQKLINSASHNTKEKQAEKWALLVTAWNLYRKGKEVKMLRWDSTGDFPKAI